MKYLRRLGILICAVLLLSTVSNAIDYVVYEPMNFVGGFKDASVSTIRWREGKAVPFSFRLLIDDYRSGSNEFQEMSFTFQINSTLNISHTLDEERVYTNKHNVLYDDMLDFEIQLLELPEKQTIDFDLDIHTSRDVEVNCDRICITVHKDGSETPINPIIEILVLNCQYGVFIFQGFASVNGGRYENRYEIYKGIEVWITNQKQQFFWIIAGGVVTLAFISIVTVKIIRKNRLKKQIQDIQNQI